MVYAVVEISGSQIIVEPGKFYDVNYINVNPGDIITLNRVLFLSNSSKFDIGYPCLKNIVIKAKVLRHLQGQKLTVFKMKPKKNVRTKKGHRQKLTRILIEDLKV
uniref:Large ribosomal subunit protein bL21c n=1 Tax=Chondria sp. (in: red algae) TaxID=1982705 RepID=A0A1Z1MQR6_9FLOR|nr:ribosomal protein L21 [Chondria sp. (in: red algae)]